MAVDRPHPKDVGDSTQALVLARLVQAGKIVLVPFGDNRRYDLAIDENHELIRIQCKTGRLRDGAIRFNTSSVTYHHPVHRRKTLAYRQDYRGAADLFGVYCPETDEVYLVPVAEVGVNCSALRVEPTRNSQSKKIRWAKDFVLRVPG